MMSSNRLIRLVTFDAMNTLIRTKLPMGQAYASVASRMGLTLEPELIDKAFSTHFHRFQSEWPCYGFHTDWTEKPKSRVWWLRLVRLCVEKAITKQNCSEEAVTDLCNEIYRHFGTTEAWTLMANAQRTLSVIKRKGLRIAVISNFDERLRNILTEFGIMDLLDGFLLSSERGIQKPDPRLFQMAMREMQIEPNELLHIGDHPSKDYGTATNLGCNALLLNDASIVFDPKLASNIVVPSDRIITDLIEVLNFI